MLRAEIAGELPFFNGLSDELGGILRAEGEMLGRLPAGESLFEAGDVVDGVYFALDVRKRPSPAPVFVRVEIPAAAPAKPLRFERIIETELFGETEFFSDGLGAAYVQRPPSSRLRETRAQLLTAADVVRLPLATLSRLLEASPLLRQRMVRLGARRLKNALTSQLRRRHLDLDASLADQLLELASDYGRIYGNYAVFTGKVAQEEIAADLGVSRRALTERFKAWSEAGLIRTTPLAILDVRRVRQLERIGIDAPAALINAAFKEIGAVIDAGDLASARAMSLDLAKFFPSSPQLAFAGALAAARADCPDDARAILAASGLIEPDPELLQNRVLFGLLKPAAPVAETAPSTNDLLDLAEQLLSDADGGDGDTVAVGRNRMQTQRRFFGGEILALQGRLAKERAIASQLGADALAAAELYAAAHDLYGRNDVFAAANAASLFLLAGDTARAAGLASVVVEKTAASADYWSLASRLEAFLVLGDKDASLASAHAAFAAEHSDGMVASTRRQLRRLRPAFGPTASLALDILKMHRPFVFSGTMIHDGQFDAAPEAVEAFIAAEVAKLLRNNRYGPAYGPLARGSDIIIAEAVLEAGIELNAVLPFEVDAFIAVSVETGDSASARWRERFDDVIGRCTSVTIAQPGKPLTRDLDISFRHGFRYAAAQAIERANDLETEPLLLAVVADGPAGEIAGSAADIADWSAGRRAVESIQLPFRKLAASGSPHLKDGFSAVVFYFPDPLDAKTADSRMLAAVAKSGVEATGLIERRIKDGRLGAAAVFDGFEKALDIAFELQRAKASNGGGNGRVICDYGPVVGRSGEPDDELVARMAGASDFPGFPADHVLAAAPFAREMQFASAHKVRTVPAGQRAHRATERGRVRIVPSIGVYGLVRD